MSKQVSRVAGAGGADGTAIHAITDAMVAGQRIDDGSLWACSWAEVPWSGAGIESSKLEYLAYRAGLFYEGHRAEIDCLALLEVLRRPFAESGASALNVLLESARAPSFRLWAAGSPFESKDVVELEEFDARTRYSGREGKKERVRT